MLLPLYLFWNVWFRWFRGVTRSCADGVRLRVVGARRVGCIKEGNLVAPPSASLRPAAARLSVCDAGRFMARLKSALPGRADGGERWLGGRHRGRQFSCSAFGSAPACGSKVEHLRRWLVYGPAKAGPFRWSRDGWRRDPGPPCGRLEDVRDA
jgi:hypothetical protein